MFFYAPGKISQNVKQKKQKQKGQVNGRKNKNVQNVYKNGQINHCRRVNVTDVSFLEYENYRTDKN